MTTKFDNSNCDGAVHNSSKGPVFPIVEYRVGDYEYRSKPAFDGCETELSASGYSEQRENSLHLKRVEAVADNANHRYNQSKKHSQEHGFTTDKFGNAPTTGFMVSVIGRESVSPVKSIFGDYEGPTYGKIFDFCHNNWDRVVNGDYIGGWVSEGRLYLDVSVHFADRSEAIDFAVANDQLAIFDLDNCETINV